MISLHFCKPRIFFIFAMISKYAIKNNIEFQVLIKKSPVLQNKNIFSRLNYGDSIIYRLDL